MTSKSLLLCTCLAAVATVVQAEVSPAPVFSDHLMLQQRQEVPIWGSADPGEVVQVAWAGTKRQTLADGSGRWQVRFPPSEASALPRDLTIAGHNSEVVVHDVTVGEVWLCAGQSNMEFAVRGATNAAQEIAGAHFPGIRQFLAGPLGRGSWKVCAPATAADFTAVGYFFAREIHRSQGVPIGLVNIAVGGSGIEAWESPEALASDPAFAVIGKRWRKAPASPSAAARLRSEPSGIYRDMVAPLERFPVRGILWYQGESNATRAPEYRRLFTALINDWRRRRGEDLPWLFVQLANWKTDLPDSGNYAALREAQAGALALPGTGMAVAIDVGDPNNVHYPNKQPVGLRLAWLAEAQVYGSPFDPIGPTLVQAESRDGHFRMRFAHAEGLCAAGDPAAGFALAGKNRKFVAATHAAIHGDTIEVWAAGVPEPVAVRYAWTNNPRANLYNARGLPAAPFRSDGD